MRANGCWRLLVLGVCLLAGLAACAPRAVAPRPSTPPPAAPSAAVVSATAALPAPTGPSTRAAGTASPAMTQATSTAGAASTPAAPLSPPDTTAVTPGTTTPATPVPPATVSATETATPVATVPPAGTPPAAAYPVAPVLAKAQRDYETGFMGVVRHNYPGDPLEPARQVKMAEQSFGGYSTGSCDADEARFLWREDTKSIYFLLLGNHGLHWDACRDFWQVYPDTWQPGESNNEDLTAPEGRVVPHMGFGKVWRERFYGKSPGGLGFPAQTERYYTATVQRFANATAIHVPDTDAVYVLFDAYAYVTRSGDTTGQVWFRVP